MPVDVSAPFPDLDLRDQSIITVDTGDPNAIITRLVIHVSQDVPEDTAPLPTLPTLLGYDASEAEA